MRNVRTISQPTDTGAYQEMQPIPGPLLSDDGERILKSHAGTHDWEVSEEENPSESDDDDLDDLIHNIKEMEALKEIMESKSNVKGVRPKDHQLTAEHNQKRDTITTMITYWNNKMWETLHYDEMQLNCPLHLSLVLRRGGMLFSPRLINCLCVRIHRRDVPAMFKGFRFAYAGAEPNMAKGTFDDGDRAFWDKIAPYKPSNSWASMLSMTSPSLREVAFYFCGVPEVFDVYQHFTGALDMLKLLGAANEDSLNESIFARSFLHRAWEMCGPSFWFARFRDLVFILLLFVAAQRSREGEKPKAWVVACMLTLAVLNVCGQLIQFGTYFYSYRTIKSVGNGIWTFLPMWIDLYVCGVVIAMTVHNDTFFTEHRVFLAYTILAKWVQLMLHLLAVPKFGKTVLPACAAIADGDSTAFLLFLMMFALGCTHCYYALPVVNKWSNAFLVMFRLIALGDMDVDELEGKDANVVTPWSGLSNESTAGEIDNQGRTKFRSFMPGVDDPGAKEYWKPGFDPESWDAGVQTLLMFISTFATIILMNVYIGVLGSAYDDAKKNVRSLFNSFRAQYMLNLLIRRKYLRKVGDGILTMEYWFRTGEQISEENENSEKESGATDFKGMWIVAPRDDEELVK